MNSSHDPRSLQSPVIDDILTDGAATYATVIRVGVKVVFRPLNNTKVKIYIVHAPGRTANSFLIQYSMNNLIQFKSPVSR